MAAWSVQTKTKKTCQIRFIQQGDIKEKASMKETSLGKRKRYARKGKVGSFRIFKSKFCKGDKSAM